jgi:hypothetical protein
MCLRKIDCYGSSTLAFWMCCLYVRFTDKCVFDVIFELSTLKMASKTHLTVKRTFKLHIQNASVMDLFKVRPQVQSNFDPF